MKKKKKKKSTGKEYSRQYYLAHQEEIKERNKAYYHRTKKKTPKCKMCGNILPRELPGLTKYCDQCLYSRGHGEDAHRMAAVRWYRKNKLDKRNKNK